MKFSKEWFSAQYEKLSLEDVAIKNKEFMFEISQIKPLNEDIHHVLSNKPGEIFKVMPVTEYG